MVQWLGESISRPIVVKHGSRGTFVRFYFVLTKGTRRTVWVVQILREPNGPQNAFHRNAPVLPVVALRRIPTASDNSQYKQKR